jgi:hypothetical protein
LQTSGGELKLQNLTALKAEMNKVKPLLTPDFYYGCPWKIRLKKTQKPYLQFLNLSKKKNNESTRPRTEGILKRKLSCGRSRKNKEYKRKN